MKTEDMAINIFDENGGLRDKETILKETAKVYDDLAEEQKSIESEFSSSDLFEYSILSDTSSILTSLFLKLLVSWTYFLQLSL